MLSIKNLTKKFAEVTAVDGLSLEIESGKIYALIGPNGSGKTTTVKVVAGLYRPNSGRIEVDGFDSTVESEKTKSLIGYIPDEPFVYEKMTGREFLHFVGTLFGMERKKKESEIEKLLDIFPLRPVIDGFVDNYSRGNKQKLSIIAALLHGPKVLLVDEPIVGLDPESAITAKKTFLDFAHLGGSILVCTHTLSFAESIANKIGLLKEGKLIKEGSLLELKNSAGKPEATLEELYLHFTK